MYGAYQNRTPKETPQITFADISGRANHRSCTDPLIIITIPSSTQTSHPVKPSAAEIHANTKIFLEIGPQKIVLFLTNVVTTSTTSLLWQVNTKLLFCYQTLDQCSIINLVFQALCIFYTLQPIICSSLALSKAGLGNDFKAVYKCS